MTTTGALSNTAAPADANAIFTRGGPRGLVASRNGGGLQGAPLSRNTLSRLRSLSEVVPIDV